MEKRYLKTAEVAKILKIDPFVINYYYKEFSIPVKKDKYNRQIFSVSDVSFLEKIYAMREEGLDFAQIKDKLKELEEKEKNETDELDIELSLEVPFIKNSTQRAIDLINSDSYKSMSDGEAFLSELLNISEAKALQLIQRLMEIEKLEKTTKDILDRKEKEEKIEMVAMLICKKNENRTITLDVIQEKYMCTNEEALSIYKRIIQLETTWETLNAVIYKTIQEHPEVPLQTISEQTNRPLEAINSIYADIQSNKDISESYKMNDLAVAWEKEEIN